jgi:hypothetical protein
LSLLTLPSARAEVSVSFGGPKQESVKAGYLQLEWHWQRSNEPDSSSSQGNDKTKQALPQKWLYQLQRDDESRAFSEATTVYRGKDAASFVSGLSEGKHHYRVRIINAKGQKVSPWSQSKTVIVDYHSWTLTWILFATGGIIFLILVTLLILGSRKEKSA